MTITAYNIHKHYVGGWRGGESEEKGLNKGGKLVTVVIFNSVHQDISTNQHVHVGG